MILVAGALTSFAFDHIVAGGALMALANIPAIIGLVIMPMNNPRMAGAGGFGSVAGLKQL